MKTASGLDSNGVPCVLQKIAPGPTVSLGGCFDYSRIGWDTETFLELDRQIAETARGTYSANESVAVEEADPLDEAA